MTTPTEAENAALRAQVASLLNRIDGLEMAASALAKEKDAAYAKRDEARATVSRYAGALAEESAEAVARAICAAEIPTLPYFWDGLSDREKDRWRAYGARILAALRSRIETEPASGKGGG